MRVLTGISSIIFGTRCPLSNVLTITTFIFAVIIITECLLWVKHFAVFYREGLSINYV